MLHVGVPGASGRMGRELLNVIDSEPDLQVTAGSRTPGVGPIEGVTLIGDEEFLGTLTDGAVDVVIDFTVPAATRRYLDAARDGDVPMVIGTTGFEDPDALLADSPEIPVLKATNFAPGVHVLRALLAAGAELLTDYECELIEAHHSEKRDAPSGTAQSLLTELTSAGVGQEAVYGRHGTTDRTAEEIGVHPVRAGTITGWHELLFAGNGETISLRHQVEDRAVFATGAVTAARWLVDQPPGQYTFDAVVTGGEDDGA